MLKIVEKSKIWFSISIVLIVISIFSLAINGLNFGIDFKGGTKVLIDFGKDFSKIEVEEEIIKKYANDAVTTKVEGSQLEIKSNNLDSEKVSEMFKEIKDKYSLESSALVSQEEIGASIGKELTKKSIIALMVATLGMLIYVRIRFEISFALAAILALLHDVIITLGIYSLFKLPVNSPFIAAILTIVGYSINDTIVIFDRIRENLKIMRRKDIGEVANASITQTLTRSINTVLTTLITIVSVYIFVPAVREFTFPITVGILWGSYSSIFIASPLWVVFKRKFNK
ncbi:protein translocase subunit SecF [Clostridium algidicarnis]|uniref:Protein-export membrane protein SecF n=2 Tax=Clostridium algidicarnis TaxID=37659 RepID=A0A2S6G0Z3_9CLOT|nr:protein translocase subunit SecF [Clostridium algidicarnis]MBB6630538.1 protein translocase subunit SecF [Clostridium algidicarnis]MBB6696325.1 protein translocase subunit SecF [Clostridium algidicarnis]MBU3193544.1 protein translocase subunit SecF [Clostridium algidicarnis]MBU3218639.1 protein translocase subunit SecF [Clostridium algidicarnis]PPK49587.1 preprotein translocase subunit SecF [Clostridium algidicarnis DSM 15099]